MGQTSRSARVLQDPLFAQRKFNPSIMGGRACIRGMRITVSLVVNLVANGMSPDEIVRAVLRFGAGQRGSSPLREPRGVKLLADMRISMATVRALREAGEEVVHLRE